MRHVEGLQGNTKTCDFMPLYPTRMSVCFFLSGADVEWKGGQLHCMKLGSHCVSETDSSMSNVK